uniref:Paraflagellar rod protein n=1 Tax=Neobodo designis TaxID=312471 RepID=A0A7S1LAW1_NEODS
MSAQPEVSDVTLEAARKQKIHNLKLKTACLENEELIQELHVSDWSENQRQKLRGAHDKANELLVSVEVGTRWNLTEAYDLAKLMRVCGLEMSQRELYKPEDKAQFMDIISVKKVLQDLKQNRNKTRVVSFTQMIDNSIAKVEKVEEELRRSQLDASQLAQVPSRTLKQIEDIMNVTLIQSALASTDDQIKTQLAQLEKTNEIQNTAMHDGEMQVAEEQMWTKIQLQEHLIELIKDKFRLIQKCEDENAPFKKIYDVQKAANQETSQMKDGKRRLKQRCETDLKHIHDAIQKADLEDAEAMKRYAASKEKSERFVKENVEKQEECWNKIQDLERQLQKLGTERFEEVKRRIEEIDREEKRRVEYAQFLEVASQHKKLLELTVYNCDLAIRCIGIIEELVAEGCSAIKARYDKTNQELADLRLNVHQEYLEAFRRLYKTLGQLVYKKEKRLEDIDRQIRTTHIQLEFAIETFDPNAKKFSDTKKELYKLRAQVEEEMEMLKDKMAQALEAFGPTEDALLQAGIEFVHPAEEVEDNNLGRRSKMVEYRAHMAKQEEVKIAAEREELKRVKAIQSQQYRGKPVQQIE